MAQLTQPTWHQLIGRSQVTVPNLQFKMCHAVLGTVHAVKRFSMRGSMHVGLNDVSCCMRGAMWDYRMCHAV